MRLVEPIFVCGSREICGRCLPVASLLLPKTYSSSDPISLQAGTTEFSNGVTFSGSIVTFANAGIYRIHAQIPITSSTDSGLVLVSDNVSINSTSIYLLSNSVPYYFYTTQLIKVNAGSTLYFNVLGSLTIEPSVNGLDSILTVDVLQLA